MHIMVVGNLSGQLISAGTVLAACGAQLIHAGNIDIALHNLCAGQSVACIVIAVDMDIAALLQKLRQARIAIPVVACGLDSSPENAADAIRCGAIEYLPLPPNERLVAALFDSIAANKGADDFLSHSSESFQKVLASAEKVASSNAAVLLTGASGVGKKVVARFIHKHSKLSDFDMHVVNCAALSDDLLESEMFGYECGAFIGATEERIGKFEKANGSIILLNEIGAMSWRLQEKLLRVLQRHEMTRMASNINIKVIATSSRDLLLAVKQGKFRQDLFYRLNVARIEIPNLKDRNEDIEILADHFLRKYIKINELTDKILTTEALHKLCCHSWPGNITELENAMHRAVLTSQDYAIKAEDVVLLPAADEAIEDCTHTEKKDIAYKRDTFGRSVDRVASVLGISIQILQQKVQQYYIDCEVKQ